MASMRRQEAAAGAGPATASRDNVHASSTDRLPPTPVAPPPDSHAPLKKSISFSEYIRAAEGPMARDRESTRRRRREEGGDSADETTSILGSEAGGGKNYSTGPSPGARTPTLKPSSGTRSPAARVGETSDLGGGSLGSPVRRRSIVPQQKNVEPWWKRALEKYGSVELENKGSVARDHLALERTFLAWLRTSLSFASIGIAITQLFRLNTSISTGGKESRLHHVGKPLGSTFIAISIIILFIGFHRYFESQHYVIRGKFPASRGSIVVVTGIAGSLIVASLVVVLAIGRGSFES